MGSGSLDQFLAVSFLELLAAGLLVYAALHDFAVRTVPNWLPVCLIVLGVPLRIMDHMLLDAIIIAAVEFVLLFLLWLRGYMGGGDVKLWGATVMLIPPIIQPELNFVLYIALFGGVLALVYLVLCKLVPRPHASRQGGLLRRALRAEAWRISHRAPLPYACAIAVGAIATLLPLSLQR
jgi:prepilin peptidase CpaA